MCGCFELKLLTSPLTSYEHQLFQDVHANCHQQVFDHPFVKSFCESQVPTTFRKSDVNQL